MEQVICSFNRWGFIANLRRCLIYSIDRANNLEEAKESSPKIRNKTLKLHVHVLVKDEVLKTFRWLTLRTSIVNWVRLQCMQTFASLSGTHTAAWCSTGFLPPAKENTFEIRTVTDCFFYITLRCILFLSKSSMHLFICAIHSCFSVLVAAYTANDLVAVRISHPFRYSVERS